MNIPLKNDVLHAPSLGSAHKRQIHSYGYKQTQMMSKIKSVLINSKRQSDTPFETEPSTSTTPQTPSFSFRKTSDGISRIKASRLATRTSLSLCPITRNTSQLNTLQPDQTPFQTDRTLLLQNKLEFHSPRNILTNPQQLQKSTSLAPTQIFNNMIQSSRVKKIQSKCFQQSPILATDQSILHLNSQPISSSSSVVTCSTQSDHPILESTIGLIGTADNFKIHQPFVSSKQKSLDGDNTLQLQVNMNPQSPKEHPRNEMSAMIKKHRKYSMQAMASMRRKNELLRQFLFLNSKAVIPPQGQQHQERQQDYDLLTSALSPSVKQQLSLRPKTPSMNLFPVNSSSSLGFAHFTPFQQHQQYSQIVNSSLSPRFDSTLPPQTQSQSQLLSQQIRITSPKIITSLSHNQLLNDSNLTPQSTLRRIKPQTSTGFSRNKTENSVLIENSENKQTSRASYGYTSLSQLSKNRYASNSNGVCLTEYDDRSSNKNKQNIIEKCDKGEQTAEGEDIFVSSSPLASQMMASNPLELQYIETLDFTDNHQANQGDMVRADFMRKESKNTLNGHNKITINKNNHIPLIIPKEFSNKNEITTKKNNSILFQQLKIKAQESVNQQKESQAQMQSSSRLQTNGITLTNRGNANHEKKLLGYGIIQSENDQQQSPNADYQSELEQKHQAQYQQQQFQVHDLQKGMMRGWSFSLDLDQQHQGTGIFEVA